MHVTATGFALLLFDIRNGDCCNRGSGKLTSWSKHLGGRHYLSLDSLQIECVIDIRHFRLAFWDPPEPKFTSRDNETIGMLASEVGANMFIHINAVDEPIPAQAPYWMRMPLAS